MNQISELGFKYDMAIHTQKTHINPSKLTIQEVNVLGLRTNMVGWTMQSLHKQTYESDVGIAVKKTTLVGTVRKRNNKEDHQWVMEDLGFKINNKISRETRMLFA